VAVLERYGSDGFDLVFLDATCGALSIGKSPENHIVIADDPSVSRLHAQLEHLGPAWCITDLGSRNGTHVNGDRIITSRQLFDRDEILLGRTRLVLRDTAGRGGGTTTPVRPPPPRTPTEQKVLIELCRPVLTGQAFTSPASVETIAAALFVGAPAIRQHLGHLYDKFGIDEEGGNRRERLANEAILTGAVTLKDLKDDGR
jgi:hypothetical protein